MLVHGSNVKSNRIPAITFLFLLVNIGLFAHTYTLEIRAAREQRANGNWNYFGTRQVDTAYRKSDTTHLDALQSHFEDYGFSIKDLTERHEYHSLISHMFTHSGLGHLIGNMLMLWGVGVAMESALGSRVYLVFYFVCGFIALFSHALIDIASDMPMVGASGAIAGLMGGFFVLFGATGKLNVLIYYHVVPVPAWLFAALWIGQQIFGALTGGSDVAWMAHLGGCVAGAAIVYAMKGSLDMEIETDNEGNVQIIHEEDKPQVTDADMFEKVLDLHPVRVVVEEVLGSDAKVFCPDCSESLNLDMQIGERLIRCENCSKMVFVDGYLIVRSQMRIEQEQLAEQSTAEQSTEMAVS